MTEITSIICTEKGAHGQPLWMASQSSLFWIEHTEQKLYQYHEPSQEIISCDLDAPILSISPRIKNGFIATLKDGIGFFDAKDRKVTYIAKPEPFLDPSAAAGGIVDNDGHYWTNTHRQGEQGTQTNTYQVAADLSIDRFSKNSIHSASEPAFSKDGSILYQSCINTRFVYATTMNKNKQAVETVPFCRLAKPEGVPHGLCVDSEDNLWVCHWGAGYISCFDKRGQRIQKIAINSLNIGHCAFGGEHLDTLFIATSSDGRHTLKTKKQTLSGCMLSIKPGVTGLQANHFSG